MGDPSLPGRVSALENNEYEVIYFESVNSSTGTVTPPAGATIRLDQFQSGADAFVSTIFNGQPTGDLPRTAGGVDVDVSSFDSLGNYVLTGVPSSYPVAIIYIFKIKGEDWSSVDLNRVVDYYPAGIANKEDVLIPVVLGFAATTLPDNGTLYFSTLYDHTTVNVLNGRLYTRIPCNGRIVKYSMTAISGTITSAQDCTANIRLGSTNHLLDSGLRFDNSSQGERTGNVNIPCVENQTLQGFITTPNLTTNGAASRMTLILYIRPN